MFKFIDFGLSKKINELTKIPSKRYIKYDNEYYYVIYGNEESNEEPVYELPGTSYFKMNVI